MSTQNNLPVITIDELAIMIAKGFKEMDKGFEAVDRRFVVLEQKMNSRFEAVDRKFEGVDNRFAGIESDIKDIKRDMATKDDIAELKEHLAATDKFVYKDLAPRVRRLEHAI